jgi:hypothetical protein
METIKDYVTNNKIPILIALLLIGFYVSATTSGDQICDCETVEKEKQTKSRRMYNSNNYNHK